MVSLFCGGYGSVYRWDVLTHAVSVSRGKWCSRQNESVDSPAPSDCLKQVGHSSKSHHETKWVGPFFFLFFYLSVSNVPSGRTEWQRSLLPDFFSSSWPVDSKLAAELCSRWQSHKDKLPCRSVLNATHSFPSPDMLRNTIPTDALLLTEILLRWPRLPVETSLPLDFGATPINESKVGSS